MRIVCGDCGGRAYGIELGRTTVRVYCLECQEEAFYADLDLTDKRAGWQEMKLAVH